MKEIKARIGHMYPITEVKDKEAETIGFCSMWSLVDKHRTEAS